MPLAEQNGVVWNGRVFPYSIFVDARDRFYSDFIRVGRDTGNSRPEDDRWAKAVRALPDTSPLKQIAPEVAAVIVAGVDRYLASAAHAPTHATPDESTG